MTFVPDSLFKDMCIANGSGNKDCVCLASEEQACSLPTIKDAGLPSSGSPLHVQMSPGSSRHPACPMRDSADALAVAIAVKNTLSQESWVFYQHPGKGGRITG